MSTSSNESNRVLIPTGSNETQGSLTGEQISVLGSQATQNFPTSGLPEVGRLFVDSQEFQLLSADEVKEFLNIWGSKLPLAMANTLLHDLESNVRCGAQLGIVMSQVQQQQQLQQKGTSVFATFGSKVE